MARHDEDLHFLLRETPLHPRDLSYATPLYTHHRDGSIDSRLFKPARPATADSFQPYKATDFADSTSHLISPRGLERHDNVPSNQEMQPQTSIETFSTQPESTGLHPGYPGPESLAVPEQQRDKRLSWKSFVKESIFSEPADQDRKAPSHAPLGGPPPDGGATAWLQVLGGYFLFFNTWGLINAFGVFQTYYKGELIPNESNSSIAWIGTLTSFLLCASPISWGPVFDIGSPRLLVLFGSFSVVFGIMMTSLCHSYWQLMLAQGICCGIGGGALFITATSVLPSYFSKKRALAMGISASGSSLGGIIYPIIFTYTQPRLGFGWSVRIIGFLALLTLAIPCLVIRPRAKPPTRRRIFDASILREVPFGMMNLATFFGFVGQYIPYFFIEQFAAAHGIDRQFWMLICLNAGSIPGRIVPSLLADRCFHPLKVLAATTAAAALLAFAWIAIRHSVPGLVVWCLLYGFCSGAFVSLQGAAVASMTTALGTIGTRFGVNMFAGALGILIGSPVGGAIFPASWPGAQAFCGVTLGLATIAVVGTYQTFRRCEGRDGGKGAA